MFNRSHYENVTVTRCIRSCCGRTRRAMSPKTSGTAGTARSTTGEHHLAENGTVIIKLFLNLSRDEQTKRFLERVDDTAKNWKVSPADADRTTVLAAIPEGVLGNADPYQHQTCPWHVISRQPQVVLAHLHVRDPAGDDEGAGPRYPELDRAGQANLATMRADLLSGK